MKVSYKVTMTHSGKCVGTIREFNTYEEARKAADFLNETKEAKLGGVKHGVLVVTKAETTSSSS